MLWLVNCQYYSMHDAADHLVYTSTGHNMSQADANSVAEENQRHGHTGTGCYKQYDHHASRPPVKTFPTTGAPEDLVDIRPDDRASSPEYQTPVR